MSFDRIVQFGFTTDAIQDEGSDSPERRGVMAQNRLAEICRQFATEKKRILADDHLSQSGKNESVKRAARAALKQIDELKLITLDVLDKRYRDIEAKFHARVGLEPSTDVYQLMREQEARQLLRQMSPSERLGVLERALADADEPTFRGILFAPRFEQLLLPKVIDEAKSAWIAARNPREAEEREAAEKLFRIVSENFAEAYNGVAAEGQLNETWQEPALRSRLERLQPEVTQAG